MAEQINQEITIPNDPPSSRDRVSFRLRADAFVAWMKTFATQINSLIPQLNTALEWINTNVQNALTYSQTATTQADIATTKASEANASATAALASKEAAEAIFDNFDDKYLGAKATAPTLDNDGNALVTGALYFKTTAPKGIYVYDAELSTWSSPTYVPTSHGSLSGRSDEDAHPISSITGLTLALEGTKGIAIASAESIIIGTAGLGNTIHITGTSTILSLGKASQDGVIRTLIFDGILTLTHNTTSLILPDSTSIITAVGDTAEFVCENSVDGYWRCLRYTRAVTPSVTFDKMPAGSIIDSVTFPMAALVVGSTAIPHDDTIPQITEGVQIMTATYTPKKATSKLKITVTVNISMPSAGGGYVGIALFRDGIVNAIGASHGIIGASQGQTRTFTVFDNANSTTSKTYSVRAGSETPSYPPSINGFNGSRYYGGAIVSSITIEEISQ